MDIADTTTETVFRDPIRVSTLTSPLCGSSVTSLESQIPVSTMTSSGHSSADKSADGDEDEILVPIPSDEQDITEAFKIFELSSPPSRSFLSSSCAMHSRSNDRPELCSAEDIVDIIRSGELQASMATLCRAAPVKAGDMIESYIANLERRLEQAYQEIKATKNSEVRQENSGITEKDETDNTFDPESIVGDFKLLRVSPQYHSI